MKRKLQWINALTNILFEYWRENREKKNLEVYSGKWSWNWREIVLAQNNDQKHGSSNNFRNDSYIFRNTTFSWTCRTFEVYCSPTANTLIYFSCYLLRFAKGSSERKGAVWNVPNERHVFSYLSENCVFFLKPTSCNYTLWQLQASFPPHEDPRPAAADHQKQTKPTTFRSLLIVSLLCEQNLFFTLQILSY